MTWVDATHHALAAASTTGGVTRGIAGGVTRIYTTTGATTTRTTLLGHDVAVLVMYHAFLQINRGFVDFLSLFGFHLNLFIALIAIQIMFRNRTFMNLFSFALFHYFKGTWGLMVVLLDRLFWVTPE